MSWELCLRGHLLSKCREDLALFDVGTSPLERINITALDGVAQVQSSPNRVPLSPILSIA